MTFAFHIARLLLFATLGYQAPRLTTGVPPSPPANVVIGNTVLATAQLDEKGTVTQVRVLQGVTPFTEEAERSISRWRFDPARLDAKAVASEVSVIMMFRPYSFGNAGVGGPTLGFKSPDIPQGDHPALPITLFDPELPVTTLLNPSGVVVFDLEISESGSIYEMRVINDVPDVTERARKAVKQWGFAAAVKNGKPVRSTVIVGISFVTPVTQ